MSLHHRDSATLGKRNDELHAWPVSLTKVTPSHREYRSDIVHATLTGPSGRQVLTFALADNPAIAAEWTGLGVRGAAMLVKWAEAVLRHNLYAGVVITPERMADFLVEADNRAMGELLPG